MFAIKRSKRAKIRVVGPKIPFSSEFYISRIEGTPLSSIVFADSSLFSTKLSGQDDGNDDDNHLAKVICYALKLTKGCKIFFLPTIPEEKVSDLFHQY